VPARATLIGGRLRRRLGSGQPVAAAVVMGAIGALPAPVHTWFADRVRAGRFTDLIVSYLPGPREQQRLAGAPVRAAVPVVPLAPGVPVGVAAMRWADVLGVGVRLDASLAGIGDGLVTEMHAALDQILGEDRQGARVPAPTPPAGSVASGTG
jgi:diacylglycerol O-acyltransferase